MKMYRLYEHLPVALQNVACSLYGYRESRLRFPELFHEYLAGLKESDSSPADLIQEMKRAKLVSTLLAARGSGLYPRLASVSGSAIAAEPWGVLGDMPVLTKDGLRGMNTVQHGVPDAIRVVTSGTTGKALALWKDRDSFAMQWAVWFRHRARFGVNLGDPSVNFTGKPVVPIGQKKPPFWRFNRAQNQYLISMQHINSANIGHIVDFLNSIRPKFYSGYPSIIAEVARLAMDDDLCLNEAARPDVVFTGAENVLAYQSAAIAAWTGAVITDQYGLTEGNCNFSKCEHGNYHEDYEMCHVELVDRQLLSDGAYRGRLIGTAFYNHAMPLIRYDTGDIAVMAPPDFCCPCGRSSAVILSVDGRQDDYVLTPDGRHVMRFDYLFKGTIEVVEAQVIQDVPGEVTILSVPSGKGDLGGFEEHTKRYFSEYISTDMSVNFRYVDMIERSSTGKFKAVLNRL
jgi:phenylacetate-CoA ligase